ncbi:hypothetical protein MNAN1_003555 [Malassezia nana]|uniref:CCDC174 alpha/beta GRSR domain-containing protein n=1 Tax=Malassezia nana TaxID=180528 RepID=A0AAF0EP84_9BASI|nr:hypothetical protein MNAN1_003555 [Malassezia nana]
MPSEASSLTQLRAELHAARERAQVSSGSASQAKGPLRLRSDAQAAATPRRTEAETSEEVARHAASARALAHKAARYDKLAHGYGLEEDSLVDWDAKDGDGNTMPSSPPPDDQDTEALVEYTDEFGRTRTARASDVPREYLRASDDLDASDDDHAIYGPATSFPVYRREAPQLDTRIAAPRAEAVHFDADWEVRDRGAAFYRFSRDEATRQAQQAELQARRAETVAQRAKEATHATTIPVPGARAAARRAERWRVIEAHRAAR